MSGLCLQGEHRGMQEYKASGTSDTKNSARDVPFMSFWYTNPHTGKISHWWMVLGG